MSDIKRWDFHATFCGQVFSPSPMGRYVEFDEHEKAIAETMRNMREEIKALRQEAEHEIDIRNAEIESLKDEIKDLNNAMKDHGL